MKRAGSAVWTGGFSQGSGTISTISGALAAAPYSVSSRFEDRPGTNPEELIGAAHAGCFSMAFALVLGDAGHTPERIETEADVILTKGADGFSISAIHLTMRAKIPGLAEAGFHELADKAKANCPVSKVLNARISLDATLEP